MKNKDNVPIDIISRELYRLDNDLDRLQMLVTLKSHLNHLQINSDVLQKFFSIFNDEKYRLQAIQQLMPAIYTCITTECLPKLLELFHNHENRLTLIENLKNSELLKTNTEINEILLNEYRQYFHIKKTIKISQPNLPIPTTSDVVKVPSDTSGVFEKAKQFVCRVFGGSASPLDEQLPTKRLIVEENASERKKFHSIETNSSFQPTSLPTSQSYTSLLTKSPPPSPITRQSSTSFPIDQSSLPIQSMMVTQIHSILDNIDSVLNKIEAQTLQPPTLNTHDPHLEVEEFTQTTIDIFEQHVNLNDGGGDTTVDLIELMEESDSILSSDESEFL